jgi:hypothetical protein
VTLTHNSHKLKSAGKYLWKYQSRSRRHQGKPRWKDTYNCNQTHNGKDEHEMCTHIPAKNWAIVVMLAAVATMSL